ncbi:unnamed protein product [Closterium sp. NIES-54]
MDAYSSAGSKGQDDKEASFSLVAVVELTVSVALEAGEDFQAMAAAVQSNPEVVLLNSSCPHHLMGTKDAFVDLGPSGDIKHVRGFNGALQDVQGLGTVTLQGEAEKQVLIPDVLYVSGVRANLLSASQLKENGVKLQEDDDGMLLVSAAGDVLGRASYTGRVFCTDLRPCLTRSPAPPMEIVALRAIISASKSTPDRLHARLAHVGKNTIQSSAKHEVATRLDLKSASGADLPCVSCIGGKLARHSFPDQGSDVDDVLAVVHVDLCRPFRVAAKDGSLYFLLLKDRKTRYVWVKPVAKKSDALQEFVQWLAVSERKQFTEFVNGKGIIHDLTCPYTPQQNGMAEREMRTVVESVRTMLLHMGVQHHWWHLALRQAVWRGEKLKPKARWGLHLGVSEESKGWELLNITDNRVVTTSDVVFYQNMSLKVWKSEHGPASWRTPTTPPTDTLTATLPLLVKVGEPAAEDVEDVPSPSPSPSPAPPISPLVADLRRLTPASASGDEGSSGASPKAPTKSIVGGRREVQQVDMRVMSTPAGEEQTEKVQLTMVKSTKGAAARKQPTGEQAVAKPTTEQSATGPPDFVVPTAFTTVYDVDDDDLAYGDDEDNDELTELDLDMHADPEHHWDILTMTVKEVLASWKGVVVKAAMEEEIRSLIGMGMWELVERPPGVNIMKNRWKKSQVDTALYFKVGADKVVCWVLVYVDDLLADSSSTEMLKELKELLEAAFELRKISPVQKYLGLEIVRNRSARKLWLHQQGYIDKLRRRFLDEEQTRRTPKTPVSVDAYAELTFDDEKVQERQEEEYRQKVGSLQFAATMMRSDIAFACSKMGSGLTLRSYQHWRKVDRCLAYLANMCGTALEFGGGPESLKLVGYMFVYRGSAVSGCGPVLAWAVPNLWSNPRARLSSPAPNLYSLFLRALPHRIPPPSLLPLPHASSPNVPSDSFRILPYRSSHRLSCPLLSRD